jgi:hypothetical protein
MRANQPDDHSFTMELLTIRAKFVTLWVCGSAEA